MQHAERPPPPFVHPYISDELVERIADDADAGILSVWKRLGGGLLRPKLQRRVDRSIAAHLKSPSEPPRSAA